MKRIVFLIPLALMAAGCGSSSSSSCECTSDQICVSGTCQGWTELTATGSYGFADYTPKGSVVLYKQSSKAVDEYSIADDSWSQPATGLSLPGSYSYPAWSGDTLYSFGGSTIYEYSITDKTVSSRTIVSMPSTSDAQTTADESGNLYVVAEDATIVQYNPATDTLDTFPGPAKLLNGEEPRAAWDAKTGKVYLGDYMGTHLYSLDPATETVAELARFPDSSGMNERVLFGPQGPRVHHQPVRLPRDRLEIRRGEGRVVAAAGVAVGSRLQRLLHRLGRRVPLLLR